ncbi:MAG: extracellular solute-binding protein [Muribaculaceae bacterium]|nr:extracellular solute-binding protein [Muribaculaceae bacterium]
MKKRLVLVCLLLSAVLLASCGGLPAGDASGQSGVSRQDLELTLWAFPVGNWGNPTAVSNLLAGFHKEYPNVHVSVEYLNYETGDERIAQAAADGCLPDLVLEGPERLVASWGEQGWMVDLSDLWASGQAGAVYGNVRAACRHADGAYYEFPICMSAHCMAINYDMFREAGALQYIDEASHTWTTEDFISAVHALTAHGQQKAGVVYCRNQGGDQGTRALVTNLYGGSFTDKAHTSYTVNSWENRQALQLLYDLDGIVFDPDLNGADAVAQFCSQETAMCFCWNASLEMQQTINNPDFDFDVFPMAFPTNGNAPELQCGIWGFGVFDNGSEERAEAAKAFIRYMTEDDAVYTRAVLTSFYWPVRDLGNIYENDILMTEYSVFTPYVGDYYQVTPGWAGARTAWWRMLAEIAAGTDVAQAAESFSPQG